MLFNFLTAASTLVPTHNDKPQRVLLRGKIKIPCTMGGTGEINRDIDSSTGGETGGKI